MPRVHTRPFAALSPLIPYSMWQLAAEVELEEQRACELYLDSQKRVRGTTQ